MKYFQFYFVNHFKVLHLYMAKKKQSVGRKPVKPSEKVILVGFYTKRSVIDSLGGMDRIREIAKEYVESRAEADEVGRMAMHG